MTRDENTNQQQADERAGDRLRYVCTVRLRVVKVDVAVEFVRDLSSITVKLSETAQVYAFNQIA